MLKRENRLGLFSLKNSNTYSSNFFNVKFDKNDLGKNRFAFVVSKKIDSRAVGRNRVKRKFRTFIETKFDIISPGNDFIFYPKGIVQEAATEDIDMGINLFLEKFGLIKK